MRAGLFAMPAGKLASLSVFSPASDSPGEKAAPAYPIAFTGCHDIDMRSLLPRVIEALRRQVVSIDAIIDSTADDAVVQDLAREAKATSQRHIQVLEQVATAAGRRQQESLRSHGATASAAESAPASPSTAS